MSRLLLPYILRDKGVASFVSTSDFAVKKLCEHLPLSTARSVVECGPGTGVITKGILSGLSDHAILHAIETNSVLVELLNKIEDPRLQIHQGSAMDFDTLLPKSDLPFDILISGIPLSFFTSEERKVFFRSVASHLSKDGVCLIYQFTAPIKKELQEIFSTVECIRIWRNIPPLKVFICRP